MQTLAAVVRTAGELTFEEIVLDPPKEREVLVRMTAAGVCHSDLHTYLGELRVTPPLVLGHEGAGVVEAVGAEVTRVSPGDRVMVNWLAPDETCPTCLRGEPSQCERFPATLFVGMLADGTTRLHTTDGVDLKHYLSSSTMAERMVFMEESVVPIPPDFPDEVAAITGCAVLTGAGAVINTARPPAGSSAMVIGCGGIGLSMIQGCRLAGCHPIVAVDLNDEKLELGMRLGASHAFHGGRDDVAAELARLTRVGPDYVFDSVGSEATIRQGLEVVRPGGEVVVAGMHAATKDVSIPAGPLVMKAKTLRGSFAGTGKPRVDLPRLVELYRAGRLQLDEMVTARYRLEQLPEAFEAMAEGHGARSVIVFDQEE